jgi:hypothetical protein
MPHPVLNHALGDGPPGHRSMRGSRGIEDAAQAAALGPPDSPTTAPQDGPPEAGAFLNAPADDDDGYWLSLELEGTAPPPDEDAAGDFPFPEERTRGIIKHVRRTSQLASLRRRRTKGGRTMSRYHEIDGLEPPLVEDFYDQVAHQDAAAVVLALPPATPGRRCGSPTCASVRPSR